MANQQKVIATAGLVSVAVGSANSMVKYKRPPSSRFLIGSGIAYLILSAMGASDALGELAKGLAVGIMTTIVLGEGGGVMTYFVGPREVNTTKRGKPVDPTAAKDQATKTRAAAAQRLTLAVNPNGAFRRDVIPLQPFQPYSHR